MRPAPRARVASDFLRQVKRTGNVDIDNAPHIAEVLIEKRPAQSPTGIGQQCVDRPVHAFCRGIELLDPVELGEIGLYRFDLAAQFLQFAACLHYLRLVGGNH